MVLENINFLIKLGEIIVIVGFVGVGKLILVNILFWFLNIDVD